MSQTASESLAKIGTLSLERQARVYNCPKKKTHNTHPLFITCCSLLHWSCNCKCSWWRESSRFFNQNRKVTCPKIKLSPADIGQTKEFARVVDTLKTFGCFLWQKLYWEDPPKSNPRFCSPHHCTLSHSPTTDSSHLAMTCVCEISES